MRAIQDDGIGCGLHRSEIALGVAAITGLLGLQDAFQIAVFAALPGSDLGRSVRPSAIAWDEVLNRPMFVPGKQYLYGLHLLTQQRIGQFWLNLLVWLISPLRL